MKKLLNYEASEFTLKDIEKIKGDRKIFVVFSTFGEREADLVFQKISLIKNELGSIVDKIILSHRRSGSGEDRTEQQAQLAYSNTEIIVCNDYNVPDMSNERGKGADMRRTLYHINTKLSGKSDDIIVFLDTDVVEEYFGVHFVLGLAGAILKGADFSKSSFWREMGRVKKFVAQPLFSLIKHDKLDNLQNLHYPLSGEVAGTIELFNSVNFWQLYGVETGINIDLCFSDYTVADVNIGKYDHEHHGDSNIQKMAFGIMRTYMSKLIDNGVIELKDGAELSDIFNATFINENKNRENINFDLTEIKYKPLSTIL